MSYHNISVVMSASDVADVKAAIATINSKMPFLVALSPDEKKKKIKLGPKSMDFVQDSFAAVQSFPGIVPGNFDIAEYEKDTELFKVLTDLKLQLDSVSEKLNNTYTAVGNEAMVASLDVYSYVKTGAKRIPGLKSVYEKLKVRFKQRNAKKPKDPETGS